MEAADGPALLRLAKERLNGFWINSPWRQWAKAALLSQPEAACATHRWRRWPWGWWCRWEGGESRTPPSPPPPCVPRCCRPAETSQGHGWDAGQTADIPDRLHPCSFVGPKLRSRRVILVKTFRVRGNTSSHVGGLLTASCHCPDLRLDVGPGHLRTDVHSFYSLTRQTSGKHLTNNKQQR